MVVSAGPETTMSAQGRGQRPPRRPPSPPPPPPPSLLIRSMGERPSFSRMPACWSVSTVPGSSWSACCALASSPWLRRSSRIWFLSICMHPPYPAAGGSRGSGRREHDPVRPDDDGDRSGPAQPPAESAVDVGHLDLAVPCRAHRQPTGAQQPQPRRPGAEDVVQDRKSVV